jgi:hypothetical protein
MSQAEISTCQFHGCGRPLGLPSKDAGWVTCNLHRECSICGSHLTPIDARIAFDKLVENNEPTETLELIHSRCAIASRRLESLDLNPTLSIKQSTFNLLNAARLMVDPDMNLAIHTNENNAMLRSREFCDGLLVSSNPIGTTVDKMSFDAIYTHQKMLEACLAAVSLLIAKQDRPAIKARADAREAIAFKKATQEAKTSARPVQKAADDSNEVELAKFMEMFNIKERKLGLDLKRRRDKAIDALVKMGIPQAVAIQSCNADILKERGGQCLN